VNKKGKIFIVLMLFLAVGAVLFFNSGSNVSGRSEVAGESTLPHLVDLGADKCIPCKMMAPVLEGLKEEYAGRLQVTFIDVWKDPAPGRKYGINVIPTQIFLAPDGRELFRHEGFYSREDILSKWRELGFELEG
jgi:thioredoxin 1